MVSQVNKGAANTANVLRSVMVSAQNECAQKVMDIIVRTQKLSQDLVTIDSEFVALGIDSIDAVEILFELESQFDIEIPDQEMHSVRTVRQAAEAVERLLTARAPAAAT
jgi:acyl carrier protein